VRSACLVCPKDAPILTILGGEPFLVYWVRYLVSQGIENILFASDCGPALQKVLGDGGGLNCKVWYSSTLQDFCPPQFPLLDPSVPVCRGDVYFPCDFSLLADLREKRNAGHAVALKFLKDTGNAAQSILDGEGWIRETRLAPGLEGYLDGGVRVVSRETLQRATPMEALQPGCGPDVCGLGLPDPCLAVRNDREDMEKALMAVVNRKKKSKAVFLDRDGVINEDSGYVIHREQVVFSRGIFSFSRLAQRKGYKLIVVTNQSGVARGYFSLQEVEALNRWIAEQFERNEIKIAEFYVCPYHEKASRPEFQRQSLLRKPNPGMILLAAEKWNLELPRCFMVGDKHSDRILWPYMPSYIIRSQYTDHDFDFESIEDLGRTVFQG